MSAMIELECLFRYESAHFLPHVPEGHKCGNMHGHSYELTVVVRGPVRHDGFVCDFADVKAVVNPLIHRLDHQVLNDFLPNPTVEEQLIYLWDELQPLVGLFELRLRETATNSAVYRGEDYL